MLAFCAIGKLESMLMNLEQIFAQAGVKSDVLIDIPVGYDSPDRKNET